ncbi:hypothetical protein HKD37_04G010414 [Glycine soja]
MQVGQLAKQLAGKSSKSFGKNTEKNPKEECKVVVTRSRKLVAAEDEDVVALKEQAALKDTTIKKKNEMASRKRKSAASRPQAQYDTRRFESLEAWNRYTDNILDRRILSERNVKIYHTEFDEFKAELERHNLHKRLTNLQDGSIDLAMVKEFYANSLEGETLPTYSRFTRMRIDPQEFVARLCILERGFVLNAEGHPWKLLRKDLTTLAQTWSVFSYSNLTLTSHTSDLNMDRARLVYGLVMGMDMNIGALISGQISTIAQSNSSRLEFPALITALCRARGVTSDSLTYESLSPAINLAYIKKNCWNVDDLTVNFKRARKVRARPTDIPSSSAPPTPSTFSPPAPPTSVTPTPAAQDPQRFEAMLQSIHQGQILLLQSLQVVAPPGSILLVEQFIKKVSWLGTLPSVVREGEGPSAQHSSEWLSGGENFWCEDPEGQQRLKRKLSCGVLDESLSDCEFWSSLVQQEGSEDDAWLGLG